MPPADPAAKAVEAWAVIRPNGKPEPYARRTKRDFLSLSPAEISRGWRIARVSITELCAERMPDDTTS